MNDGPKLRDHCLNSLQSGAVLAVELKWLPRKGDMSSQHASLVAKIFVEQYPLPNDQS